MKKILFIISFLVLFLKSSFSQEKTTVFTSGGITYDITYSWTKAQIKVPNNSFNQNIDSINITKPTPVILLMHGCAGITNDTNGWASFFTNMGFVVVMPDSFAIPNRKSVCDIKTQKTFGGAPVVILRNLEADYAMKQLQNMSWVDKKNIFIMGHSEGSIASSHTVNKKFNGIIVSGYHCYGGVSETEIPLLAINFETDPWLSWYGNCKNNWGNRKNAKQIILKGNGHNTFGYEEAMIGVEEFLKKNLK